MRLLSASLLTIGAMGFPISLDAPPLCNFEMPATPKIGNTVPLCLFMMSAPKGFATAADYVAPQIKSMAFGVQVDTYAMLDMMGSYEAFNHPQQDQDWLYAWMTGAPTMTGWARECALEDGVPKTFPNINATTAYSCPQLVMTVNTAIPLASIVAIMDNGVLTNLIWDNQCQTCPTMSDLCIGGKLSLTLADSSATQKILTSQELSKTTDNKICSLAHDNCKSATNKTGQNCDFRVLLTWDGTDADGKRLLSSNLRMTQFSGTSVGSMWNSVANSFNPNEDVNAGNTVDVR